jgi:hypothetical protein
MRDAESKTGLEQKAVARFNEFNSTERGAKTRSVKREEWTKQSEI